MGRRCCAYGFKYDEKFPTFVFGHMAEWSASPPGTWILIVTLARGKVQDTIAAVAVRHTSGPWTTGRPKVNTGNAVFLSSGASILLYFSQRPILLHLLCTVLYKDMQ